MVSLRRRRPFQLMVLRRLRELKKIVPVGARRKADVDVVLRQTAEYICALELKVAILRRLSDIYVFKSPSKSVKWGVATEREVLSVKSISSGLSNVRCMQKEHAETP
ncbi:unnamed protein product [Miscanthus lutarioriparius]|uniref:Uncharacterized protein n=1 Tax=Miscanthus lutarioriparius TaxID=422564 RepID=A0A811PD45_9POAL|nr:unnamed protein product [Miscanthus lutarioriparius]